MALTGQIPFLLIGLELDDHISWKCVEILIQ